MACDDAHVCVWPSGVDAVAPPPVVARVARPALSVVRVGGEALHVGGLGPDGLHASLGKGDHPEEAALGAADVFGAGEVHEGGGGHAGAREVAGKVRRELHVLVLRLLPRLQPQQRVASGGARDVEPEVVRGGQTV
eukprot:CAMPEP_0118940204 /NCGR_PEP_ID=MMETSP1169-20130426/30832_1 /TAXON_ID=36882 /ORGANISM="Pyramimonas obovata, Strain CCMP722" /LENGTH=135 /DNA_ID=CAMNT_0006884633 /DNA_START=100 /DNA_END=508 /DNA_ORIENTATION=+